MPRHDNDRWDIVSSVGLTALMVAGGRAIESQRSDALIHDPFADALVSSAGSEIPVPTRLPHPGRDGDAEFEGIWSFTATHMGVRTRFFDDFFRLAWEDGVSQAVILASGLDARAWRLDWPDGFAVFEIDQPKVLEYKEQVLDREGARPRCAWHGVPIDLREDWPAALRQAGFDPSRPTAWLAEGLLPYLPDHAEERLFAAIHSLSAPGSRVAVEHVRSISAVMDSNLERYREFSKQFGIEIDDLLYDNDGRPDPDARLAELGWQAECSPGDELAARYGRPLDGPLGNMPRQQRYVTARLPR